MDLELVSQQQTTKEEKEEACCMLAEALCAGPVLVSRTYSAEIPKFCENLREK